MSTKQELRGKLFATEERKRLEVTVKGATMEVIQPTVGDVLDLGQIEDQKVRLVRALVLYARVPGTDEAIFEDTDMDQLMAQPYSAEWSEVQTKIGKLMGNDVTTTVTEATKN